MLDKADLMATLKMSLFFLTLSFNIGPQRNFRQVSQTKEGLLGPDRGQGVSAPALKFPISVRKRAEKRFKKNENLR